MSSLCKATKAEAAAARPPPGPTDAYEILAGPEELRGGVTVDFDAAKHARARLDAFVDDDVFIDQAWLVKKKICPLVFDGKKFRLAGVEKAGGGVVLRVGLTTYREYVGTQHVERLRKTGARKGDATLHLSCALGCEAVLVTSDAKIALLRRSTSVAAAAGRYNGPSGHPEPRNAGDLSPAAVRAELLSDAILTEVSDETGAPKDALGAPRLIGVMRDSELKPDLLFRVDAALDSAALRARYEAGEGAECWESDRLAFVDVDDVGSCDLRLTAVTRAAFACLGSDRAGDAGGEAAPGGGG